MKRIHQLNAMNVGGYVSKEHFDKATSAYQEEFPGIINSITIKKEIIVKALNSHEWISGIRFMYGLDDPMNPNSIRVFLIPCTHTSENLDLSKPLVAKYGYYDHAGHLNTLTDVVKGITAYVGQMTKMDDTLIYKEVTRGNFLGKNSLLDLVSHENCECVSIDFGLQGKVLKPVFRPINSNSAFIEEIYMNVTNPCPPFCGDPDSDPPCKTELTVSMFSNEKELDIYRYFRDFILLELENGEVQYEMYYFISPLITAMIDESENKEEELRITYYEKIVPFKELLAEKKFDEANNWLKETFEEWVSKWQVSFNVQELS
ncbi:hypothetical protein [uncultured Aquimarina sp.]|uniref:hypothetical protein n=1 Tax=uncultured Aquimarina sp. TaxID=575652 RepID=UPI002639CC5F|nr:hypothetical protein [uncultured Aquimarina sp.]